MQQNLEENNKINLTIEDLSNYQEMLSAYDLIDQRYQISYQDYQKNLAEMIKRNAFKMIAVCQNIENNQSNKLEKKIIGISGYSISLMLYCKRFLQLSSFIVDEKYRNLGVGKLILAKAEEIAKENDCQKIVLDSFTINKKSHHLYFREGFKISAFHFIKDLA
jgi:GNAT superfamily N-acetyltransferase